jgi:microcin C transport system substrate-binding protein
MNCVIALALFMAMAIVPVPAFSAAGQSQAAHGVAMSGEPKYGPGFEHFDYVNPNAPKGGRVRLSAIGTFDSFNPFISKGVAADGIALTTDTLTVQADDEPFTQYGLIARSIEMPPDRSWVAFHLDPRARFHDGTPITAEDVAFTFHTLMEKGDPTYRKYYADVAHVDVLSPLSIRFRFKGSDNRELPLILGQLPVLPRHWWADRDFARTTLEPPLGSGPYKVGRFQAGRSVTYERVQDYWAVDHPVNRGRYNFNAVTYDYYRDATVALHAFRSGEYDFREENTAKDWATGYVGPPFRDGMIRREEIKNELPRGMQGFVFNTRRELFQDRRVREALSLAFDFEWSNRSLFYGQYVRSASYFSNSELASSGLPTPEELALLEPLRDQLPGEVFTREFRPPASDGMGFNRENLLKAVELLREAGWEVRDKRLVHSQTGRPFRFEILLLSPAFERVVLPYMRNLGKLGIQASIRLVDVSQYINRIRVFDFDMLVFVFGQSNSPGNEQRYFWHSESADLPGSRNLIGIRDPAIDRLVDLVISAPDRESLIHRTRALDRALLWGHYVVPHWHSSVYRVAYWNMFEHPAVSPKYDLGFFTWWVDGAKERVVGAYRRQLESDGKEHK